jgi:hypothetical protein
VGSAEMVGDEVGKGAIVNVPEERVQYWSAPPLMLYDGTSHVVSEGYAPPQA